MERKKKIKRLNEFIVVRVSERLKTILNEVAEQEKTSMSVVARALIEREAEMIIDGEGYIKKQA